MNYADPRIRKSGVDLITAERKRQVEEGWTPDHDDEHHDGALAWAAGEMAVDGHEWAYMIRPYSDMCGSLGKFGQGGTKPDRVRLLTIAGALIAAEIDRLLRAAEAEP